MKNVKVLEKVKDINTEKDIDTELNESMWENRKILSKNLPQTNLSTILDMHKSNKYSSKNLIASKFSSVNNDFEANFKRVRIVLFSYFFIRFFLKLICTKFSRSNQRQLIYCQK